MTDADGLEHAPDNARDARSGVLADKLLDRSARSDRASSPGDGGAGRDWLAFLTEASRRLAVSLDYESSLTTVAGMSLPLMKAWVIVDVLGEDGGIRRLTVQHPDSNRHDAARALRDRYQPVPGDFPDVERVIREGHHELASDITAEVLASRARDAEHLALLEKLSVQAYLSVPMAAHGTTWGASPTSPTRKVAVSAPSTEKSQKISRAGRRWR